MADLAALLHADVCACPGDDTDPGCHMRRYAAETKAARLEAAGVAAPRSEDAPICLARPGEPCSDPVNHHAPPSDAAAPDCGCLNAYCLPHLHDSRDRCQKHGHDSFAADVGRPPSDPAANDEIDVERLAEAMWNAARQPDNATWAEMTTRPGTTSGDLYRNRAARLVREYVATPVPKEADHE